jgi:hypothetical protein
MIKRFLIMTAFLALSPMAWGQLAIGTTNTFPLGFLSTPASPYSVNLTAILGTPPYTWTLLSGTLPTGLTLSTGGIDTAAIATGGTGCAVGNILLVTQTGASHGGFRVSAVSSGVVTAIDRIFPGAGYSVANGLATTSAACTVNPTLNITSLGGIISGTPTVAGTFTFTIRVTDGVAATADKSFSITVFDQPLDLYGGLTNMPCTSGAAARFYTQKMGNRWYLCTPLGNAFFMANVDNMTLDGVTDVYGVQSSALVGGKYAAGLSTSGGANWALQSVRRIQSWGFNTIGTFAYTYIDPGFLGDAGWPTSDHTIPLKLPYVWVMSPSFYSMYNAGSRGTGNVKNLGHGLNPAYLSLTNIADIWDVNWLNYVYGSIVNDTYGTKKAFTNTYTNYMIGIEVDNADWVFGSGHGGEFNAIVDGTDIGNKTGYAQAHLGLVFLATKPIQTSDGGITFTDPVVYTKAELSTWLSTRYSANIASLNTAWTNGAAVPHYTTFTSSNPTPGAGWGTGTGILDEDGTCPSKSATCWIPQAADAILLTTASAAMKADLDAFLLHHFQHYFSTVKTEIGLAATALATTTPLYLCSTGLGGWNAPPRRQILQAAGASCDVVTMDNPEDCPLCTDDQTRTDFIALYTGDKPWIKDIYLAANPDSYEAAHQTPFNWLQTQPLRGQWYANSTVPGLLNACDTPTGNCHMVGSQWWAMYDSRGENENWGLATPRDDPYDGLSTSITQTYDPWGYQTGCVSGYGCERAAYGDFLTSARAGNLWVLDHLGQTTPAVASLSASAWTFLGSVGVPSATLTVTFSNSSTTTLNITSIAVTGTGYTVSTTCGSTLAAQASCTATVTFTPTMKASVTVPITGLVTFTTDSNPNPVQTVTLTGTAKAEVAQ